MGDRNNPIKFGPEWLRNLSRERSAGSASNSQSPAAAGGSTAPGPPSGASGGTATNANLPNTPKVLLAKLRYGREEMLALYDRTSEAPQELKYIDILYQPRGKPPVALNNSFEEDNMRDPMRTGPPLGGVTSGERFGIGRGMGRGTNVSEVRGRGSRLPFVRQISTGRGTTSWHLGNPRMPGYSGGADDDANLPQRSWNNTNGGNAAARSGGDQGEWNQNKTYRSKRPGTSSNWRTTRDDEEWRASDNNRSRSTQEKWERDWGDRPLHRRTWVGGDSQSGDDNLPEWAVDSAEACGGTFDSLGAFHGYSNDDTNLPKSQEAPFALTRSHTHGSFARSKTIEEGSEEWWASEKAKKLSPKRFDASDIKFKKQNAVIPELSSGTSSSTLENNQEESSASKGHEKLDPPSLEPSENSASHVDDNYKKGVRFTESKKFDSFMRSDINLEEASDERGNFQSVMINTNNSLRQKHQNIVQSAKNIANRQNLTPGLLQLFQNAQSTHSDTELLKQKSTPEDKIVDDLIEMALEDKEQYSTISKLQQSNDMIGTSASGLPSSMSASVSQMTNATLQQLRMSSPVHLVQGLSMNSKSGLPAPGMQLQGLQGPGIKSAALQGGSLQSSGLQGPTLQGVGLQSSGLQAGLQGSGLQAGLQGSGLQGVGMQGIGLPGARLQGSGLQSSGMQNAGLQTSAIQSVGITNSALNASLGLPLGPSSNALSQAMGIPMPGVPPPVMPNQGMGSSGVGSAGLQSAGQNIPGFPSGGLPGMSGANVVNSSLFLGQNTNTGSLQSSNELQMNHGNQNMYPLHGLQHSSSQTAFNSTMYSNMMQQTQSSSSTSSKGLAEQWYYEDPKKNIQGPFTSKEMYNWYSAGFFSPSLMVRRACDPVMRPLGTYGPVVPFAQDHGFTQDHMMSFPITSGFDSRNQGTHESMLNTQQGLGLDVMNMSNTSSMDTMQMGSMGIVRNPPFRQQQMVESLWSQTSPSPDLLWMQQAMNARNESRVNNLPMFFWDQQPSALASNTLIPEGLPKEMKTEDEILAQLRAQSQVMGPQKVSFGNEQPPLPPLPPLPMPPLPPLPVGKPEDAFAANANMAPNLEELHKLIQEDSLKNIPLPPEPKIELPDSLPIIEQAQLEISNAKQKQSAAEAKAKQTKESEKTAKSKENNVTKNKSNKKVKEEKKEDSVEIKKDEDIKADKRSVELSPTKGKKEDKTNKKELEKEKKEWVKEGFTIVKTEKPTKDNKKKAEEIKVAEEIENKRKEEEKLVAEEEKKKRQADLYKKQQEIALQQQQQQQRQAAESVTKKAPWSGVSAQTQTLSKEGITLAEIQRLEREKKLEQMKEQQHMMQLIAQQQAVALAREQEMQVGLGWAKKKSNLMSSGQSLADIQAEARKQAVSLQGFEEISAAVQTSINNVPWGSPQNGGGGFWDTPAPATPRPIQQDVQQPKPVEPSRSKKKPLEPAITPRKEVTPAVEFDSWCTTVLTSWSAKIDVPTFFGFLKDIESPYEVKDYVKCYLGDSKDSNDFARQFLERRSKLLRVGMVTPSDDLCSPAMAVNPRTPSSSDQEAKSKGKKAKKNKMMKVDAARLLGFSVTAAEDRINVGDIDTV